MPAECSRPDTRRLLKRLPQDSIVLQSLHQRLFLKEADSGKLRQLSLSEELLKEDFVLNGMLFKNEEGLGFEYTQYLDMDQINWYGYISWEDLLSDENNVKVLIEPRMTSRGYPLDEDGNVIGAQE